jgi:LysR family transcriptional regulator for bpeEF and oprC
MLTAASPKYVERHGRPVRLDELQRHYAVNFYSSTTGRVVVHNFIVERTPREVQMRRSLLLSDIEACVACGLEGAGIIQAPKFLLQQSLNEGRLVELLSEWKPLPILLTAQYAPDQHVAGKVEVFVEWMETLFRENFAMDLKDATTDEHAMIHRFNEFVPSL